MKWIIVILAIFFLLPGLYGQATIEDIETLKSLGYKESEILQKVKELGGFPDAKKHYIRLRQLGFSASLLQQLMELSAKPKLPELPEELQKLAKRVGKNEAAENIWVLAVGVNTYLHSTSFPKLDYAAADAEGFARHMVSLGIPADQICLLTERQVTNQKLEEILGEITKAKGDLYIFYAGHGLYIKDLGFLFACHDADPKNIKETTYSMNRLKKALGGMEQERALLFLDACHSGGARGAVVEFEDEEESDDASIVVGAIDKAAQSEIKEMNAVGDKQVAIITSCRENQLSKEGKGHGLFTQSLLSGLSGKADQNRDGHVLSKELFFYLNRELPVQSDLQQMPDCNFSPTWEEGKGLPTSRFSNGNNEWPAPGNDTPGEYQPIIKKPQNDRYEPNDHKAQAREMAVGRYDSLQIVDGEEDWYSFYLARPSDCQIVAGFSHRDGDIDIALYDAGGVLSRAESTTDHEEIHLKNLIPGRYWLLVRGSNKVNNVYDMEIHARERVTFDLQETIITDDKGQKKEKFQLGETIHLKISWNVTSLPVEGQIYEWLEVKGKGIVPYKQKFRNPAIRGSRHLVLPVKLKSEESGEYPLTIEMRIGQAVKKSETSFIIEAYGLPGELWKACSYRHEGKYILDMTTDYWKKLPLAQQTQYAEQYQKEYARVIGVPVEKVFYAGGASIQMRLIPPARFLQGSPSSEPSRKKEETQHPVVISKPFWLQKTEFTLEQCKQITGKMPGKGKRDPRHPVTHTSWVDVEKRILAKLGGDFSLPTEAQWEYACRAGTLSPFYWGDSIADMGKYANVLDKSADGSEEEDRYYYDEEEDETKTIKTKDSFKTLAPVASLTPNAFGLHDMSGNVWEWCQDWAVAFSDGQLVDPKGADSGRLKICRGGSYRDNQPGDMRSARRDAEKPTERSSKIGFRLCISKVQ